MSKLILAFEDQEDNMKILRDLLTSAGYELRTARAYQSFPRVRYGDYPPTLSNRPRPVYDVVSWNF